MTARRRLHALAVVLAAGALGLAGCGGGSSTSETGAATQAEAASADAITLLQPHEAEALIATGDVELLDVRTPEEYAGGHVAGATLIDFYEPDFADRIGELDRETTYVVYCRSGNRSGQAVALMAEQGFTAVNDVDGGIVAWQAAGLPTSR
jgi:phage shock protein E